MNHYEYRSRTQMPIQCIKAFALMLRENGITKVKEEIEAAAVNASGVEDATMRRDYTRHLIASLNYSVSQAQKELRNRKKK